MYRLYVSFTEPSDAGPREAEREMVAFPLVLAQTELPDSSASLSWHRCKPAGEQAFLELDDQRGGRAECLGDLSNGSLELGRRGIRVTLMVLCPGDGPEVLSIQRIAEPHRELIDLGRLALEDRSYDPQALRRGTSHPPVALLRELIDYLPIQGGDERE
jgi:hypothetical protein